MLSTILPVSWEHTNTSYLLPAVLRSRSRSEPVLFGRSRSRCEGPAPAPGSGSTFTLDKTEEILIDILFVVLTLIKC